MAGGTGTRLWPLSRSEYPKQFLKLISNDSLLQQTLTRVSSTEFYPPYVITNHKYRFIVAEQIAELSIDNSQIILEPEGRNTAPAIALAALLALKNGYDPVMAVLASDHCIGNTDSLIEALKYGAGLAEKGWLITFGIQPTRPETGYGYIEVGENFCSRSMKVTRFVEKPKREVAEHYIQQGCYYWNSGMFMFKASAYLQELKKYRNDIFTICEKAIDKSVSDLDFIRLDHDLFKECPSDSIDYAVMEKTNNSLVIPLDAKWDDIGSWTSLWDISDKDENGNSMTGDVVTVNCKNNYFYAKDKLIAGLNITDLIVIQTEDSVLIADKNNTQDIKKIVCLLNESKRKEVTKHPEVYRPWGKYHIIEDTESMSIRRIIVKPGYSLATQIHYNRSENWVVISGTAEIRKNDVTLILKENESTFIMPGTSHSLSNPGKINLEIIEIQSGRYLNEDDVIRPKGSTPYDD